MRLWSPQSLASLRRRIGGFSYRPRARADGDGNIYVVQETSTSSALVVCKKPTTTTSVEVGRTGFKSRTEAETGMKTIKVCETK